MQASWRWPNNVRRIVARSESRTAWMGAERNEEAFDTVLKLI
jgi:hypothetical protein